MSREAQSRRFYGWIAVAERKLDRGQNRKRKGTRGGEGEQTRQSCNGSNLGNKKRKADDLQRSLALLCLCLVAVD